MNPFEHDELLRKRHNGPLAGIDEAGRGPIAGPLVAAAVILPPDCFIEGLRDSKKLTPAQREILYKEIKKTAEDVRIAIIEPDEIDRINIYQATIKAMTIAVESLSPRPAVLVIDAMKLPLSIEQHSFPRAEDISASVAAASIVAKVTRDRIMEDFDRDFPQYGFSRHKGYATREHLENIKRYGPCPIHRRSYSPVCNLKLPF